MAIVLSPTSDESIELKDYIDYIKSSVDVKNEDSLLDSVEALKALKNNTRLVPNAINERMKTLIEQERYPIYSPTSLTLADEEDFYVRANMWLPAKSEVPLKQHRDRIFSIDLPHNHNFGFITIGYFGEGYTTDIYEIADVEKIEGEPGERVRLENHKCLQLTPGKAVLYRPFVDMHTQHAPDDIAISLNLVVKNSDYLLKPQYLFDLTTNTIAGSPDAIAHSRRRGFLEMAVTLGDPDTFELVQALGERDVGEASNQARQVLRKFL